MEYWFCEENERIVVYEDSDGNNSSLYSGTIFKNGKEPSK